MPRPVHFEIHAGDPARAIQFYEAVFGWRFEKWAGGDQEYWLVKTGAGPGIDGGLLRRRGPAPGSHDAVNAYPCTVDVPDLDAFLAKATAAGATVAVPKVDVGGMGWLAYVKDTEGNVLGMMQMKAA